MNPGSAAVLVVYNAHQRDAGTIPCLLSACGQRYSLISNREFVRLRPQLAPKRMIILGGPQSVTDIADTDIAARETRVLLRRTE
jgi:GMP synthase-like glutamine amidotransferase